METKLQSKQQYPRFIQNKPCGIDKFDGGSQERLAKTIARHFCQNDSLDEDVLYLELSASKVFGDLENPTWLKCWNVNYQTTITFLSMTHGDIKRTCNAALYWNCLQANLLMMVSYLEMQQ